MLIGPTQPSIQAFKIKNGQKILQVLLRNAEVTISNNFLLECHIPIYVAEQNFFWYGDDVLISNPHKNIVYNETRLDFATIKSLLFVNITKERRMIYKCDNRKKSSDLKVFIKTIEAQKPQITSNIDFNSVELVGNYFTFELKIEGIPKPTVEWRKNNKSLNIITNKSKRIFWNSESAEQMIFTNLDFEDEGTYTIIATNLAGEDVKELKLEVKLSKLNCSKSRLFSKFSFLKKSRLLCRANCFKASGHFSYSLLVHKTNIQVCFLKVLPRFLQFHRFLRLQ